MRELTYIYIYIYIYIVTFMTLENVDMCWNYLLHQITSILDDTCPTRKRRMRCKNEPWITNEILDLIFEKNRAWKQAKKYKKPVDITHAKYLRNHTKSIIRRAKSNFVQDYIENNTISAKKFWEKITYIMPTKTSGDKISLVDRESNEHIKDSETANYINTFFANIGTTLRKTLTFHGSMKCQQIQI